MRQVALSKITGIFFIQRTKPQSNVVVLTGHLETTVFYVPLCPALHWCGRIALCSTAQPFSIRVNLKPITKISSKPKHVNDIQKIFKSVSHIRGIPGDTTMKALLQPLPVTGNNCLPIVFHALSPAHPVDSSCGITKHYTAMIHQCHLTGS